MSLSQTIYGELERINNELEEMNIIIFALAKVGNTQLAKKLTEISNNIVISSSKINRAVHADINQRWKESQDAHQQMFEAIVNKVT